MLLVIVGAGASYGCSELDETQRPHLTKDLFSDRDVNTEAMKRYRSVRPLVAELAPLISSGARTIEDELARITQESASNPARKIQLMAMRFYLQRIIQRVSKFPMNHRGGVTRYVPFISALQRWQISNNETICIVNFNYDLLLEEALMDAGIGWHTSSPNDYVSRNDFLLIKPHGSINWRRVIKKKDIVGEESAIENAADIDLASCDIQMAENVPGDCVGVPAMAVPVKGKYSFECFDSVMEKLDEVMPSVDKILTVGWRGDEEHFWPVLEKIEGQPRLMVVTASEEGTQEVFANLGFLQTNRTGFQNGFSEFIDSNHFKNFLG